MRVGMRDTIAALTRLHVRRADFAWVAAFLCGLVSVPCVETCCVLLSLAIYRSKSRSTFVSPFL